MKLDKEEVIRNIQRAIENGANSLKAITKVTGYNPNTIIKYYPEAPRGKKYSKKTNLLQHPKGVIIKRGIKKGLTLEEIATNTQLTRERIRQIIIFYGEYENRKLCRSMIEIPSIRENIKKTVISQIGNCFDKLASTLENESNWAEARAAEYFYGKQRCDYEIPLEKIIKMFEKYKEGIDERKQYSYDVIGKYVRISLMGVKRILRKINLPSLYWNSKMPTRQQSQIKNEALKRAKEELWFASISDITYFLEVPISNFSRSRLKNRQSRPFIKRIGHFALTYKIASQIYEAQDLGFDIKETASLIDTTDAVVNYANLYRQNVEQRIIKILDVLYPSETHTKPYRN